MSAYPEFGGTNEVTVLDIGQAGGTRHAAGDAHWVGRVDEGPDNTASALHSLPGQSVSYRSVGGFTDKTVKWVGSIRVKDDDTLAEIISDLNRKLHGGTGETADPKQLKETTLTNSAGRVLSEKAVMAGWRFPTPPKSIRNAAYDLWAELEITFACLEPTPVSEE